MSGCYDSEDVDMADYSKDPKVQAGLSKCTLGEPDYGIDNRDADAKKLAYAQYINHLIVMDYWVEYRYRDHQEEAKPLKASIKWEIIQQITKLQEKFI